MTPEGEGYNILKPDVTDSSNPPPNELPAEDAILKVLDTADTPLEPKIIALRARLNHNTVKVTLRRLLRKHRIERDVTGYILPCNSVEASLSTELMVSTTKASLPKVHDIHLTFKPEDYRNAIKERKEAQQLFSKMEYENGHREPDESELQHPEIPSYKNIPSLSIPCLGSDVLDRFFNPFDEMSIYQLWSSDTKRTQDIKGGFQERFDLRSYKLIVQIYGTGTIKVVISNSENPFGAIEFRECLASIEGIFHAKTGISFLDISPFFFFEKVHFNSDVLGKREFSGMTRLSCTVQQFDSWLYRVYEKVLGDELMIRSESCLEQGNFKDHNMNAMIALLNGGVNPQLVNAQIFKQSRDQQDLANTVQRLQRAVHEQYQMIQYMIKKGG